MRGRIAIASTMSVLAIVAACSSFGDAGDDERGPSGSDASSETTSPTGDANGGDGSPDAGDAGKSCTREVTESLTAGLPAWETDEIGGGTVEHILDAGNEASGAMRAYVPGSAQAQAHIEYAVERQPLPSTARATFAFQVVNAVGGPDASYSEIGCALQLKARDGVQVDLETELESGKLRVDENLAGGGVGGPQAEIPNFVENKWYSVALAFEDITPTHATAAASVDGKELLRRSITLPDTATSIRLKCGIDHAVAGLEVFVLVDDITLDVCQ
jgi:hypothetical protein